MSGAAPIIRELIGFDGAVDCEQQAGGTRLRLRGRVRGGSGYAEVWFSGVSCSGASRADAVTAAAVEAGAVSGTAAPFPELPAVLQRVSVLEPVAALPQAKPQAWESEPGAAPHRALRIEAGTGSFELHARSVQVHRDVAREFFGAVPPPQVPRATRLGWALLLGLLHLPGAARLLAKLQRLR